MAHASVRAVPDIDDTVSPPTWVSYTRTLPDGSFHLADLPRGRFNLVASSGDLGFAMLPGVRAGTEEAELTLRRGGHINVRVRDASGAPVEGAFVAVIAVDGRRFRSGQSLTDAYGIAELAVPAGRLQLKSITGKDDRVGLENVVVDPGATAAAEIVLRAP